MYHDLAVGLWRRAGGRWMGMHDASETRGVWGVEVESGEHGGAQFGSSKDRLAVVTCRILDKAMLCARGNYNEPLSNSWIAKQQSRQLCRWDSL